MNWPGPEVCIEFEPMQTSDKALSLAQMIDHTLLRADASASEVQKLCEEAKHFGFYSVCVQPSFVSLAQSVLGSSAVKICTVKICTVVGFPLGVNETQVKSFEAKVAVDEGADELDMVLNIGALKSEKAELVYADIAAVVDAAQGRPVKVILETCLLTEAEKVAACHLAEKAGAQFVKTSTGFAAEGAKLEDIRLMHQCVGGRLGVKASGGIRTRAQALEMIQAGATRLGTSHGIAIVGE